MHQCGDAGANGLGGDRECDRFLIMGLHPVQHSIAKAAPIGKDSAGPVEIMMNPVCHLMAGFFGAAGMFQSHHMAQFATGGDGPRGAVQNIVTGDYGQECAGMCFQLEEIPVAGHEQFGKIPRHKFHGTGLVVLAQEGNQLVGIAQNIGRRNILCAEIGEGFGNAALLKVPGIQSMEVGAGVQSTRERGFHGEMSEPA